jgi:hypothetical protein
MFKRTLLFAVTAMMSVTAFAQDQDAAETEAEPAVVVTNMGLVERCILPLVITEVDGEAVDDAGRYEFEAGSKSFNGYAQGDFAACATIADAGLGADNPIGSGSTTVNVPAGKAYYLGLDVRKADPKTWKVVTWRIDH